MRSSILFSLFILLGCGRELPTEPPAVATILEATEVESLEDGGAILTPRSITITVGEHATATAEVKFPPAKAPWTILSEAPAIASAEGEIPIGGTSTVVEIEGKAAGRALIFYSVPNFGRGPSTYVIGEVLVEQPTPKRRAARH